MGKKIRIAIPKGRLGKDSINYLQEKNLCSVDFPTIDNRILCFEDKKYNIEFFIIRTSDVGVYVERGAVDIGILGKDLVDENQFEIYNVLELPFGYCKLTIAYPLGNENWMSKNHIRVATKYISLTYNYLSKKGLDADIIKLYGSIELAPLTGIADIIVDLISTGQTLKKHNLIKGETILNSQACLIVNPTSLSF